MSKMAHKVVNSHTEIKMKIFHFYKYYDKTLCEHFGHRFCVASEKCHNYLYMENKNQIIKTLENGIQHSVCKQSKTHLLEVTVAGKVPYTPESLPKLVGE